jgi:hypothetical protein
VKAANPIADRMLGAAWKALDALRNAERQARAQDLVLLGQPGACCVGIAETEQACPSVDRGARSSR